MVLKSKLNPRFSAKYQLSSIFMNTKIKPMGIKAVGQLGLERLQPVILSEPESRSSGMRASRKPCPERSRRNPENVCSSVLIQGVLLKNCPRNRCRARGEA